MIDLCIEYRNSFDHFRRLKRLPLSLSLSLSHSHDDDQRDADVKSQNPIVSHLNRSINDLRSSMIKSHIDEAVAHNKKTPSNIGNGDPSIDTQSNGKDLTLPLEDVGVIQRIIDRNDTDTPWRHPSPHDGLLEGE